MSGHREGLHTQDYVTKSGDQPRQMVVWCCLTPPSNIGKGSGDKRINLNFQTAQ